MNNVTPDRRARGPYSTGLAIKSDVLICLMDSQGISAGELARRTGLHKSLIGHLRHGRRENCRLQVAVDIADTLGVKLPVLFRQKDPRATRDKNLSDAS